VVGSLQDYVRRPSNGEMDGETERYLTYHLMRSGIRGYRRHETYDLIREIISEA